MPSRPCRLVMMIAALLPLAGCESMQVWLIKTLSPMSWNGHERIELPLTIDGSGHITVPVRVLGEDAVAFVDSGASVSAMSRALVTATDAHLDGSKRVNGQKHDTATDVLVRLGPGHVKLGFVSIHGSDAPQLLLGAEVFQHAVVDMDFDAGRLTLIRPDAFTPPVAAPLAVDLSHALPTVKLRVNGNKRAICATIDTGFNLGLALTPKMASKLRLPTIPGNTDTLFDIDGKKLEVPALAPLDELQLGDQIYRDVRVVGQVPFDEESCSNLLGMALLSRHHLIFDLNNRRIWLLPRS